MKLLVYINQGDRLGRSILNNVAMAPDMSVVIVNAYEPFRREFRSCFSGETIIVFSIYNEEDLRFLEFTARDFVDVKLIVIMKTMEDSLRERLRLLNPRLVMPASEECRNMLIGFIRKTLVRRSSAVSQRRGGKRTAGNSNDLLRDHCDGKRGLKPRRFEAPF
ncbi:MAG: hypothetical protein JW884_02725 [Deltaproteobacteria bacterium]|nr:hypothetical protein [Deltaproteobacteria bacterium]